MNTLKIRSRLHIARDKQSATRQYGGFCQSDHPILFGLAPYADGEDKRCSYLI